MRRFLDWTAAQATGSISSQSTTSNRRDSQQLSQEAQSQHQKQTSSMHSQLSLDPVKELEMQHLTKLLHEIKYYQASSSPLPSASGSQSQREFVAKVHRTLPLFLNVFGLEHTSTTDSLLSMDKGRSHQSTSENVDNYQRSDSTSSSKPLSPLPLIHSTPMDRFPDLLPFAFTIARLFVSEVRQRASNKHAEDASLAILKYLEPERIARQKEREDLVVDTTDEETTSHGWNLLMSLNVLASSPSTEIIQLLCDASLPSTLIKCLYLFFDLPDPLGSSSITNDCHQANHEKLALDTTKNSPFIKAFTQLSIKLCSKQSGIDELIKKDDLRLLFGIASSQCLSHNKPWRRTAFQILLATSCNMKDNFMYLEQNMCIQNYVENMHRINSLGLATIDEFIDMIKTLLEFLYNIDVNNRNQRKRILPLMEQYKSSRLVDLIEELIIKIDEIISLEGLKLNPTKGVEESNVGLVTQQPSVSSDVGICIDECRRFGKRLIKTLTVMAKINIESETMPDMVNIRPITMSRFEMLENFRMPRPSARNCILNYDALRLLKMAWSRCQDSHISEAILDATIALFNDDKYNYFIFESYQLLVYYLTNYNQKSFSFKVKQKLFKFLEFIIIETNYIPCLELGTIGSIMETKNCSDIDLILGIRTLIACLRFNSKFSDIFREIGLLEVIVNLLIQKMQQYETDQRATKQEVLFLLLEASQYLLAGPNNLNCTQFNESGAARHVFNCLSKPEFFHLFIPTHSSSSDDGGYGGESVSRNNTPSLNQVRGSTNRSENISIVYNNPSVKQLQKVAFTIIRQLILSSVGDEHLANLLGLLARTLDDLKNLKDSTQHMSLIESANSASIESRPNKKFDMTSLVSQEVNLKICILKSLMIVLKDSHRCRTLFRKAGGFIYLVSSLVILEKSLPDSSPLGEYDNDGLHNCWKDVNSRRIWRLIKSCLVTIVMAIRQEPANLRAFSDGVVMKFVEAISKLGCFKSEHKILPTTYERNNLVTIEDFDLYKSIFTAPPARDYSTIATEGIRPDAACCQLLRFLYDMSLDMGDGTSELEIHLERQIQFQSTNSSKSHFETTKSISFDQKLSSPAVLKESNIFKRRSQLNTAPKRPPSLDLNAASIEPAILTFPCFIVSILDLIPRCPNNELMAFVCLVIKSLFKHERNQQMLCEAGMISKLLSINLRDSITEKNHFLHETMEFMLEKLAKQLVSAKELKLFFRLGNPFKCKNLDDIEVTESCEETRRKLARNSRSGSPLVSNSDINPVVSFRKFPTNRMEAFVSMMSDEYSKAQPPFVEFDMSSDGFSSIFMPSIAPVNAKSLPPNSSSFMSSTLDVHTNEKNGILGGVGLTERQFPPITGLTYSTWICIERFPSRSSDANHNLRLLTIYRGSAATGKEYSCFKIQVSALDRALIVSTQESLLFDHENRNDSRHDPDCNLRLWTPELLVEGKWHHVAVTLNRSPMKQSIIHVYVDGLMVHSQRICYISSHVGTLISGPITDSNLNGCSAAAYVNAFIGSLPQLRFRLRTQWKQGPCHLIEEPLSASFIGIIYSLGPSFIGNFQSQQKLQDLAASNDLSHNHLDLSKHHIPLKQHETSSHKPLVHQQSATVSHSQHVQLTRMASSNMGTQSFKKSQQPQVSVQNQYQLAEDRILMSLDARATSLMTLSRMRRIYTRFDCRQVSRVLGLALHENSTPILLMHNTGVHLNGASRGIGALTIGYNHIRCFVPSPAQETLFNIGGCYILLGLIAQASTLDSFCTSLKSLSCALEQCTKLQAQMEIINGHQILSMLLWRKKDLLNSNVLNIIFSLITNSDKKNGNESKIVRIQQVNAFHELICETFDLWLQTDMIDLVLEFIYDLIKSVPSQAQKNTTRANSIRVKNLKYLRDMDLLPRMLRLLPEYDMRQVNFTLEPTIKGLFDEEVQSGAEYLQKTESFSTKSVYLIKQTVFELLNRTPRQSDILYFGQFLASLLPSKSRERTIPTVKLRNILLKSLLQMITKNNQREVNNAVQEELVRILGFDWFMLFINGSHLDSETITLGYLNLMILLSNETLYSHFKCKTLTNGGWLKEPTFPTIESKFNIQLLGINVGNFLGLSIKKKSIKKEVLDAPNFFLLSGCLVNLIEMPRIYLMTFQTMMQYYDKLDTSVSDAVESFEKLNFDLLCDCLIGDTHHKRRQTLSGMKFRCYELVVCIVYMIADIMHCKRELICESQIDQTSVVKIDEETCDADTDPIRKNSSEYPTDLIRFIMYLYNNNQEFQHYCKQSDDLIEALCATLMSPEMHRCSARLDKIDTPKLEKDTMAMTTHPASKEVLELSRLIILDTMTDPVQAPYEIGDIEQMHTFEKFISSLNNCREAQGELVDMLLRQVLLMIDSTSRHNSTKTIEHSANVVQFQLLLINSINICQIVTDKIWLKELYPNNWSRVLTIIDHQMCLAEQIFKFNELLPKQNPPHAFNMQRVLNRILLFALSRPMQHISDKMVMLDLLKKIYDNRTIIILNHMHSPQSAEFFVCFVHCLIKIIADNSMTTKLQNQQTCETQPLSLIERQYGHQSNTDMKYPAVDESGSNNSSCSSALMLVSMARKVWDAIYQSKKGILSEAFDMPLALPAFTLDTSLDLMQLKPDINEVCERFWTNYVESEQRPKRRPQPKQNEPSPSGPTNSTVHLLSGRLTRVVNAASFVSRVVGATAGSMANNVNLVGEKLSQNRSVNRKDVPSGGGRIPTDQSGGINPVTIASSQSQNITSGGSMAQANNRPNDQIDLFNALGLDRPDIGLAFQAHISIIEDFIGSQLSQKNHNLALHKYLCDEWLDIEDELLLRERAIFGPEHGSRLDKWCLDLTEGPRRMRKKMVKNTRQFYENYPYRPDQYNPSNKSLRYRPPMSYDSHSYYMKTLELADHLLESTDERIRIQNLECCIVNDTDGVKSDVGVTTTPTVRECLVSGDTNGDHNAGHTSSQELDCGHQATESLNVLNVRAPVCSLSPEGASSPRQSEGDADDGDSTSFVDFSPEIEAETNSARESESVDSLSVLRLLEKNERISHMFRCSRVQGLDTHEGLLLFGREHFYLIDGFTLLKTREIKDIDSLPPEAHDPIIPNSTPNILAHSKKTCSKFSFDSVIEVHKRRYLLQPIALEIFSSDGRNTLVAFPRNIRNKVYSRLMTVSTQLTSNAHESLAGQKSTVSVEGGSGLLSNFIGETSVTQRWVRGELSNFQYLMNLNTIAGRSYNDLMQYPIFPWILADYTSDYLDLNRPSTFRDLSRPIGAQTSERLEQFKSRYADWDDNETPPYHYGTFYSSAMIVASYMVRMEPFTQHFLRLQGGHFDLADRMFHSIHDSWLSASKHNMADIKELVPEFFYLPEFLINENKFDLGIKQNGKKLDHVILPPWAKNDPREFIRLHRTALESEYVSAHLHEWIDLIFGYKQQGQAAVDAVNVFHHLFYEGNVDIYNTDIDPIKKNAVIGFINNFGQVPKQLFKKPHPSRKVTAQYLGLTSAPILPTLSVVTSSGPNLSRSLTKCPQLLKLTSATFKELRGPVGQIVQIDKNIVAVEQNRLLIPPEYCRYVAWGHADRSIRLGLYDSEKPIFVWEGSGHMSPNEILCATIPNNRIMITAGTESLITVWKIEKMRSFTPIMNLYGHVEPVTCLASSQSYSFVVSGSRDRTAIIWDLNRFTLIRQLGVGPNDKLVHHGPLSAIAINDSTGDIATCSSSWLYLWTINGQLLAKIDTLRACQNQFDIVGPICNFSQMHILSVCFSQFNEWDLDEVIVTGGSDGSVAFWSMRYYQSPMTKTEIDDLQAKRREEDNNIQGQLLSNNLMPEDGELREIDKSPEPDNALESSSILPDLSEKLAERQTSFNRSEPIDISPSCGRKRTETMNSDWVKLSTSSSTSMGDTNLTTPPSSANQTQDPNVKHLRSSPTITTAGLQDTEQSLDSPINLTSDVIDHLPATSTKSSLSAPNCDDISKSRIESARADLHLTANEALPIKFSKSDTSLVDSFVILGEAQSLSQTPGDCDKGLKETRKCNEQVRPQSSMSSNQASSRARIAQEGRRLPSCEAKLLPDHCWRRELFLRSVLPRRNGTVTGSTAVTSLAISKDHRTLFVGDAGGHTTSWTITG